MDIDGAPQPMVRAVLGDECDVSASAMLAAEQGFEDLRDRKADHALRWLRDRLDGGPRAVKALKAEAEEANHAWRTIERAKGELGARASQGSQGWVWELVEGLPI